jgi:hypothetical protein
VIDLASAFEIALGTLVAGAFLLLAWRFRNARAASVATRRMLARYGLLRFGLLLLVLGFVTIAESDAVLWIRGGDPATAAATHVAGDALLFAGLAFVHRVLLPAPRGAPAAA